MHWLFSVWSDAYSTSRCLFACLGNLPVEGLLLVAEIPHKAFAARLPICAMPRLDHVNNLGGIYSPYWQTRPCKRVGKTDGAEHIDLACRGLTFIPPGCAAWLLGM